MIKGQRWNGLEETSLGHANHANGLHLSHVDGPSPTGEESLAVLSDIRRLGGALVMTLPPALLKLLNIDAGDQMTLDVADGQLIARPVALRQKRYTLAEILAGSDCIAELNADTAWARDGGPVERELA